MSYRYTIRNTVYTFDDLRGLLAKASPFRSGDALAGLAAERYEERVAAQLALADVPLKRFLEEPVIPYETDEVTRLIIDSHDKVAFYPISSLTVGEFRDWLLSDQADTTTLQAIANGLTPEMTAAVSKIMRNQDLITVAAKCEVVTRAFRCHTSSICCLTGASLAWSFRAKVRFRTGVPRSPRC
jgi:ethanolamine ammonia-lyase large subunit